MIRRMLVCCAAAGAVSWGAARADVPPVVERTDALARRESPRELLDALAEAHPATGDEALQLAKQIRLSYVHVIGRGLGLPAAIEALNHALRAARVGTASRHVAEEVAAVAEMRAELLAISGDPRAALGALEEVVAEWHEQAPDLDLSSLPIARRIALIGNAAPVLVPRRAWGDFRGLEAWTGKVTVLCFDAHFCTPCKTALPELTALRSRLASDDVAFLSVNRTWGFFASEKDLSPEQEMERLEGLIAKYPRDWPTIVIPAPTWDAFALTGVPTYAVVDREGRLRAFVHGYTREAGLWRLAKAIDLTLARGTRPVAGDPARDGRGWSSVHLDVDVTVSPGRGSFTTEGTVTLELTRHEPSHGPVLLVNARKTRDGKPAIAFRRVESAGASTILREDLLADRLHQASIEFAKPKPRGSTIDVRFQCDTQGTARRMIAHESAAMADWGSAWLPFTLSDPGERITLSPGLFRVPGRTTLTLPVGWKGLVDGELVERRETARGVVETWDTPKGIARGFVAGPYEIVTHTVNQREVRVYALTASSETDLGRLAARLARAIASQESRLGQFPVPGAYSLVEFPRLPEQNFGAVSEQTHVIVQPPNLEYAHSNIQVFAHEASHAWWGNLIGATGPGLKWCSESLAQLGALIAIEDLEGEAAMRSFLDLGRTGTDPYYCAAGYFALARQGHDRPLATMGGGAGTHALANSKGVWVFHMLRAMLGDSRFYPVLREIIHDFAGRVLTADDVRERFVVAAPEHDLERFFAQWLDRTGAPILDVDWHANIDGTGFLVELEQTQEGEPFTFELELAIELVDGAVVRERVKIDDARHVAEISTSARPVEIRLDPDRKLLIWRPEYGPRPGREISGDSVRVAEELCRAVVGSYRFTGMEKDVEVFERDGVLYMQPAGSRPVRILHERNGMFRVDAPGGMRAEFDLSRTPAPSFVSIEGGGRERYPAARIDPGE